MNLDEKWLMNAAGWQVVKDARRLIDQGLVASASRRGDNLFQGAVASGRRPIACGLRIRSRTDVDNLCGCPTALRTGGICEHSAAVFIAALRGPLPAADTGGKPPASQPAPAARQPNSGTPSGIRTAKNGGGGAPSPPARQQPSIPKSLLTPVNIELPQDIAEFWEKNRIVCRVAAASSPTRSNPRTAPDERGSEPGLNPDLLGWLAELGIRSLPTIVSLDQRLASRLFELLRDGEATLAPRTRTTASSRTPAPSQTLLISNIPVRRRLVLEEATTASAQSGTPETRGFRCRIEAPEGTRPLPARSPEARSWVFRSAPPALYPIEPASPETEAILARAAQPAAPPSTSLSLPWILEHREELGRAFTLNDAHLIAGIAIETGRPAPILIAEGSLNHLAARVEFNYEGTRIPSTTEADRTAGRPPAPPRFPIRSGDRPDVFLTRNERAESARIAALNELGFGIPDAHGQLILKGEEKILRFYASGIARLRSAGWQIELGERFSRLTAGIERVRPQWDSPIPSATSIDSGWLETSIDFSSPSGFHVPYAEIQRLLRSGTCRTRTPAGKVVVVDLDAAGEVTELLSESGVRNLGGGERTNAPRFAIPIRAVPSLNAATGQIHNLESLLSISKNTAEQYFTSIPENVRVILRDYQAEGIRWMIRLALAGLGGLLGDEMGLGKTLQVLSFVAAMKGGSRAARQPALVVVPTSLLATWDTEAARFFPDLRRRIHHGPDRRPLTAADLERLDLVITTYGLLSSEQAALASQTFAVAVLDEASMIRNPDTAAAKAARSLNAPVRFALTGTPIENALSDAWSIFEFVAPGYLGSRTEFRERYEKPLTLPSPPSGVATRLRRRLAPYLLRRRKADVLAELPSRIEETVLCPLNPRQREVYRRLLDESREGIRQAIKRSGRDAGQARMHMLTALLRLRQACCDLRLLGLDDTVADNSAEEGKLAAFTELVREATEGGHRVLVFSQFTAMLKILRESIEKSGLKSCYLDGGTRDRAAVVRQFQEADDIPLFLISLKAGGYGLTLTAADTVVLYDPWWNPAVEAQAIDRTHRIGQKKAVTAYRLIAKGTVEEKILALQAKKRGFFDAALDDESPLMRGLSDEELRDLLEIE